MKRTASEDGTGPTRSSKRISQTSSSYPNNNTFNSIVTLNVGGIKHTTPTQTLTSIPDSMLGAMFSGRPHNLDRTGDDYWIDRSGKHFVIILKNWNNSF